MESTTMKLVISASRRSQFVLLGIPRAAGGTGAFYECSLAAQRRYMLMIECWNSNSKRLTFNTLLSAQ